MTNLRVVGDLPVWLGMLLALIVCVVAWRYYRRESFDLPHRLRWILPTLRSLAFFLGIVVLTGPVLHHRTVIGRLGRVQVYLDASLSMNLHDTQMSIGRKLMIAESHGWLPAGAIDFDVVELANALSVARREAVAELTRSTGGPGNGDPRNTATIAATHQQLLDTLQSLELRVSDMKPPETGAGVDSVPGSNDINSDASTGTAATASETPEAASSGSPPSESHTDAALTAQENQSMRDRFRSEILDPLQQIMLPADSVSTPESESRDGNSGNNEADAARDSAIQQLLAVCKACETFEESLLLYFDAWAQVRTRDVDASIISALAMFDELSRWQRAERQLTQSSLGLFNNLRQQHDVELYALSGSTADKLGDSRNPATLPDQLLTIAAESTGGSPNTGAAPKVARYSDNGSDPVVSMSAITDLSSGLAAQQARTDGGTEADDPNAHPDEDGGSDHNRTPQSAIVLLTDGQHNFGPSPLQTARVLGSQGIAVYPVVVGATRRAPDLAVVGVEAPEMVFQKDRVRGTLTIRDRMPPGTPLVIEISHNGQSLWQEQLTTQDSGERRVEFEFPIEPSVEQIKNRFTADITQHAVPLELSAAIAPLDGETELTNNERTFRLAAITQSYKLLILDGRSRWEIRYLRNAFERDTQWDVNTIIAGLGSSDSAQPGAGGDASPPAGAAIHADTMLRGSDGGQFPSTRDGLFAYDLILFGEVSPDRFTPQERTWLREFVDLRGGGIVFIDGQRRTLRQYTEQDLGPLIPIEWTDATVASRPSTLRLTDAGARLSALRLRTDESANRRFWTELPPPHKITATTALPGAEALVEVVVDGQPLPAMVTRPFGAGRVFYLAFDETWRWRYKAADEFHQRIWNQLAKYVMPRPFAVSDEYVSLDTGPVSYASGETADIRIRLRGIDGRPAIDATVDAMITRDDRVVSTVSLSPDASVPGIYRGNSGVLPDGRYEVSIRASGFSDDVLRARSGFVVLPAESGELDETAVNERLLRDMADASGGVCLREEQISRLSDLLSPLSTGYVVESDTALWQSFWWFSAIMILLTVEWFLRKRAGLM